MPFRIRSTWCLGLALALAVACDSPSEPKNDQFRLTLESTVEGTVTGTDSITYHLKARANSLFVVYVEARDSAIAASVLDPKGEEVGQAYHLGARPIGAATRWALVSVPVEGEYTIRIATAEPLRMGGRFQLRVAAVNATPETAPALIHLNDTVFTESLEQPADIDEFQFDGVAGQELNIFLQSGSSTGSGLLAELLRIPSSPGDPFANVPLGAATAVPANQDLESNASGRVTLPATGRYRFRISSASNRASASRESYRFQVYRIDRNPERAPVAIAIGDTVSESIDHVGDIDEFTLAAPAGSTFNFFAEVSGSAPHSVHASVSLPNPGTGGSSVVASIGQRLLDNPGGNFVMPAAGTVTISVIDINSGAGLYRGPYRLFVYPIDPSPEGQSPLLVTSRTPLASAIDQYGDVDEYRFTLSTQTMMSLRSNPASGSSGDLSVAVVNDAHPSYGGLDADGILDPGSYRLRVASLNQGRRGSFRGPYEFVLAAVDTQPEVAAPLLTVGDTVRVETAAWPKDVDQFRLSTTVADTFIVQLTRPNEPGWNQNMYVTDGQTGAGLFAMIQGGGPNVTPRIDMTPGMVAAFYIESVNPSWAPQARGSYQLAVTRVSAAPEHHSVSIAPNDTVRDGFDFSGDIDDYVLHGTPGQEINVSGGWPYSQAPPVFVVTLFDPATGAKLTSVSSFDYGWSQTTRIPASGQVRVRVCVRLSDDCALWGCSAAFCGLVSHPVLGYWFVVNAIDRSPESIPAAFAIGDSVSGERLENPGDIDEFRFDGTAGQQISAQLQWLEPIDQGALTVGVQLQLVDVATDQVLGTLNADYRAARLEDIALPPIALPRTGQYMVRVQSHVDPAYSFRNYGGYRFRVVAVP